MASAGGIMSAVGGLGTTGAAAGMSTFTAGQNIALNAYQSQLNILIKGSENMVSNTK